MITNQTIFWTQIGSIIGFLVALFFLYRLLVEQKDATIALQKENIAFLKDQLTQSNSRDPDVLVQSLASRMRILEAELERLQSDNAASKAQIEQAEIELMEARSRISRVAAAFKNLTEYM